MKQKTKIVIGILALLLMICGLAWWFLPVRFLRGVAPEEVVTVQVCNGNNGHEFEITDANAISYLVKEIQQIAFQKEGFAAEVPIWYQLTFFNKSGEKIVTFGVQNTNLMRKEMTQKWTVFYGCHGELNAVGEELERLESAQFPDYNKDPAFSTYTP